MTVYGPEDQARDVLRRANEGVRKIREAANAKAYANAFDSAWLEAWEASDDSEIPRPKGWRRSIERFCELGLDLEALLEFVADTMDDEKIRNRDVWRYVCGCAWRRLEDEGKR